MIPQLLVAAALVLHPHSGDITNQPDPIDAVQDEHRLEVWSEQIHDTNGPYTEKTLAREITSSRSAVGQKSDSRPRLRLKKGHEAATLRWKPLVKRYFGSDWPKALCVISFESGGDPRAKSRSGTYRGLFQQSNRYWPSRSEKAGWGGASIYDPEANVAVSAWLVNQGGWSHWTIRKCR